jgi:hypothetical protein
VSDHGILRWNLRERPPSVENNATVSISEPSPDLNVLIFGRDGTFLVNYETGATNNWNQTKMISVKNPSWEDRQ